MTSFALCCYMFFPAALLPRLLGVTHSLTRADIPEEQLLSRAKEFSQGSTPTLTLGLKPPSPPSGQGALHGKPSVNGSHNLLLCHDIPHISFPHTRGLQEL